MSSEWKEFTVEQISTRMGDAPFGANLKTKDYTEDGRVVVQGKNIQGRQMKWHDLRFVSQEKFDSLEKHHVKTKALVFPKVGTIGKVGIVTEYKGQQEFLLSTNSMMFEPDEKIADSLYVYYYFTWNRIQKKIILESSSSVQPVFNFTALKRFPINLPPLKEQKYIAKILGDLDAKIELNRKMNRTLEDMAQALFKSWFVDFDPVLDNALAVGNEIPEALQIKVAKRKAVPEAKKLLHTNPALAELFPDRFVFNEELEKWIPEGWEVKKIGEVSKVICGKTPPKKDKQNYGGLIPFIKIPFMHHDVYVLETDEYISDEGKAKQQNKLIPSNAICVSCIATVGKVVITHEDCFTNQQVNSIIPFDHDREYYLYFKMLEMERTFHDLASGGSATLNMNTRTFSNINLLSPSDNLLNLFHERVSGSFEKILLQLKQNQTLSKQRDVLLPQLISGKLRVTENGKKRNSKTEKEPV